MTMDAKTATKQCPECGSTLNRVSGKDGFPVVPCFDYATSTIVDRALKLDAFWACPACEHVEMAAR
jgi:uncharacterized protein with PIN domain